MKKQISRPRQGNRAAIDVLAMLVLVMFCNLAKSQQNTSKSINDIMNSMKQQVDTADKKPAQSKNTTTNADRVNGIADKLGNGSAGQANKNIPNQQSSESGKLTNSSGSSSLNDIMSGVKNNNVPSGNMTKSSGASQSATSSNGLSGSLNEIMQGNANSNGKIANEQAGSSSTFNNINKAMGENKPGKTSGENKSKTIEELEKESLHTTNGKSSGDASLHDLTAGNEFNAINTGQKIAKKKELKDPDDKDIEILNDNYAGLEARINAIKKSIRDKSLRDGFEERLRRCVLNASEINNTYFEAYALFLSDVYNRLYIDANFAKLFKESDEIKPSDFLGVVHEFMGMEGSDWGTAITGNLGPLKIPLSIISEVYSRYQDNKRIATDRQINEVLQSYNREKGKELYEQLFQNYSKNIEEYFLTQAESVISSGLDAGEYITRLYNALDGQITSFKQSQFRNALKKVIYTRILRNLNTYLVTNKIVSFVNEIHVLDGRQATEMQALANGQKLEWSNLSNKVIINSRHDGFSSRMKQEIISLIKDISVINSGSFESMLSYIPIMRIYLDVSFTGVIYTASVGDLYRNDVVGKGTGWGYRPGVVYSPIDCLEPVFEFNNPDPDDLIRDNKFKNFAQFLTCGKTIYYKSSAGIVQHDYLARNSAMTYSEAIHNNIEEIRKHATTERLLQ